MGKRCDNCEQPVLDTDTVCWHCGRALSSTAVPKTPKRITALSDEVAVEPLPLPAVAVYGTITAVLIIAMLLVMRSLGQKPLVLLHPNTQAHADWVPVTSHDQQFTLDLPSEWNWLEANQPLFASLVIEGGPVVTAVYPLGTIATDTEYLLIAGQGAMPQASFILIARSRSLNAITPEQSIALVEQSDATFDLVSADVVQSFTGTNMAQFLLVLPNTEMGTLRCRQIFVPAADVAYLAGGCAPEAEFRAFATPFENVLASFQPLENQ